MIIQKASNDDYAVIFNDYEITIEICNLTKNQSIVFDQSFYTYSPFLNQLLKPFPELPYSPKGMQSLGRKQKFSTIHQGLVALGLLESGVYQRYQTIQKTLGDKKTINYMINTVIKDRNHPIRLESSLDNLDRAMQGKDMSNYWHEKYKSLSRLAKTGEWYFDSIMDYGKMGAGHCELGHDIRYGFAVKDKHSDKRLVFGINCLRDFFEVSKEDEQAFHSLFGRYRSTLYDYVYMAETMLYPMTDNRRIDWQAVLDNQADALKALRPYVTFNQRYAWLAEQPLEGRSEEDENQTKFVTQPEYDAIIRLLEKHIPLPVEMVSFLLHQRYDFKGIINTYTFDGSVSERLAAIPYHALFVEMLGQYLPVIRKDKKYYSLIGYPLEKARLVDKIDNKDMIGFINPKRINDFNFRNDLSFIATPSVVKQTIDNLKSLVQDSNQYDNYYVSQAYQSVKQEYGYNIYNANNYDATIDRIKHWLTFNWETYLADTTEKIKAAEALEQKRKEEEEEEERLRQEREERLRQEREERLRQEREEWERREAERQRERADHQRRIQEEKREKEAKEAKEKAFKANPKRLETVLADFIETFDFDKNPYNFNPHAVDEWMVTSCLLIVNGNAPVDPHILTRFEALNLHAQYPRQVDTVELALLKQYVDDQTIPWGEIWSDKYFNDYGENLKFALNAIGDTLHHNLVTYKENTYPLTNKQLRFFRPYGHYILERYALSNENATIE